MSIILPPKNGKPVVQTEAAKQALKPQKDIRLPLWLNRFMAWGPIH